MLYPHSYTVGSFGCTVGFATGSVTQVALTRYGYLYWNIQTSDIKKPRDYLGLGCDA
jgi:hypothetical protein